MHDRHRPCPIEILFEDYVTLNDGRSSPHLVLLQLTSETLVIRRLKKSQVSSIPNKDLQTLVPRHITLKRHPITHSLGFSIKGGCDTGKVHSIEEERLSLILFKVFPSLFRVLSMGIHINCMSVMLFCLSMKKLSLI